MIKRLLMAAALLCAGHAYGQACSATANLYNPAALQANVLPNSDGTYASYNGYSTTNRMCLPSGTTAVTANIAFQGGGFQALFRNSSGASLGLSSGVPTCNPSGGCVAAYTITVPGGATTVEWGAQTTDYTTSTVYAGTSPAGQMVVAGSSLPSTYVAFTAPASPTLSVNAIATHQSTDGPFTVSATSNSSGAITWSVVSGPASVSSGGTVTLTGAGGTVVLQASQAAAGAYTSGTATGSFSVTGPLTGSPPFTSVTYTNVTDGSGHLCVSCRVCLTPVNAQGVAIAATFSGGGLNGAIQKTPVCGNVVNGTLQSGFQLFNGNYTNPANLCWAMTVTNSITKQVVIGPDMYPCVQPLTAMLELNTVAPNAPALIPQQLGAVGPTGPAGPAASMLTLFPAMAGLEWWLPFTDGTGATVTDVVSGTHSGVIAGSGTAAAWLGNAGLTTQGQTITLPNASGNAAFGGCFGFAESNDNYLYGLAASGHNGLNMRGTYGPGTGVYYGAHAYYPSIGYSNGGDLADSADGFSGTHCVEVISGSNPSHIIVDGREVNYIQNGNGAGNDGLSASQLTAPIYIATGTAPVYSAWAVNSTATETVAQAIARTASEMARLRALGVAFGPALNSTAYDSSCSIQGTSIDQGFQASQTPASLLSLPFSCTLHDFSISGQGPRDMDSATDTREGSVAHPKAAKNIAYHGGVTNGVMNFSEPPALALQDVLSWNRKVHALGYKTIATTMLSRCGNGYGGSSGDVLAQQYNALLLAVADEFDWLDNVASWPQLGATNACSSTTYFADGTHPNNAGQAFYVQSEQAAFAGVYGSPLTAISASYTALPADRLIVAGCSSACTVTLGNANVQSFNRAGRLTVHNTGSTVVTVSASSSQTIDGAASLTLAAGAGATLAPYVASAATGGANWIRVQ